MVANTLGHSNVSTTLNKYFHLLPKHRKASMKNWNRLIIKQASGLIQTEHTKPASQNKCGAESFSVIPTPVSIIIPCIFLNVVRLKKRRNPRKHSVFKGFVAPMGRFEPHIIKNFHNMYYLMVTLSKESIFQKKSQRILHQLPTLSQLAMQLFPLPHSISKF